MALITIDDVVAFKAVPSADLAIADTCMDAADAFLKRRIGYEIESASYTERLSGSGTAVLKPRRWPITAVTSLTVDEDSWDTLLYSDTTDSDEETFLPEHGKWLEARFGSVFTAGVGNILIVYTGGYTTIPEDLKLAAVLLTHLLLAERTKLGEGSRTQGPESIQQILRNAERDYQFIGDVIDAFRRRGL